MQLSDFSTDFAYVFKMEDVAAEAIQPDSAAQASSSPKFSTMLYQGRMKRNASSSSSLPSFLPHNILLESSGSQLDFSKVSMAEPASYQVGREGFNWNCAPQITHCSFLHLFAFICEGLKYCQVILNFIWALLPETN